MDINSLAGLTLKVLEAPKAKRSFNCRTRFLNLTLRRVDAIWINYEGVRVKYKTLDPGESFDVTSYFDKENLPWIFRDALTHTNLRANFNFKGTNKSPEIKYVTITLPLMTLREYSMQAIQKCLATPEDAFELNIPGRLQREISFRMGGQREERNMKCIST